VGKLVAELVVAQGDHIQSEGARSPSSISHGSPSRRPILEPCPQKRYGERSPLAADRGDVAGEIAASLEVFFDEASTLYERTQDEAAFQFLTFIQALGESIHDWFYKKERTNTLMDRLSELNRFFFALDPLAQSGTIQRLKQEQQTLRRTIIRIHTIRETTFVSAGYLIAEWTTAVVALALVLSKVGPFFESMFIVGVIIFLLSYLILLIRDLENPFAYYDEHSSADVSLKPLENSIARIKTRRESASAHNEKVA